MKTGTTTSEARQGLTCSDLFSQISDLADADCECTPAQQSGRDYTLCRSCMAGNAINALAEEIRWRHQELFRENTKLSTQNQSMEITKWSHKQEDIDQQMEDMFRRCEPENQP